MLTNRQVQLLREEIEEADRRLQAARDRAAPLYESIQADALRQKLGELWQRLQLHDIPCVRRTVEAGLNRIDPVLVGKPYAHLWRLVYCYVLWKLDDLEAAA
jgi:hypothetical protein